MKAETAEFLPAIPECSSRVCLEDSLGRQERKVQVSVMLWPQVLRSASPCSS